jgi:hypothetical protein
LAQRIKDGIAQFLSGKPNLDAPIRQHIDRRRHSQFCKTLTTNAIGLAFINERNSAVFGSVSDRCSLAVVKRFNCRADDKPPENDFSSLAEMHDLYKAIIRELGQQLCVSPTILPVVSNFIRRNRRNHDAVWQGVQYLCSASCGV